MRPVRTTALLAAAAVLVSAAAAVPATAATGHAFTAPAEPGVKAWGRYTRTGANVTATVCVDKTAAKTVEAFAVIEATDPATSALTSTVVVTRHLHQSVCTTISTGITAHLVVADGNDLAKPVPARGHNSSWKTIF